MKRLLVACLLAVLAAPAFAVIGTVDDVPAATLLLPYFEVDLDDPAGVTTLMSINNASATAVLAHVVALDRPVGSHPRLQRLPHRL